MSKMLKGIILAVPLLAVSACSGGVKDSLGLRNNAPDEFRVVSNAPLTVPPDFTIRPPMPGAKRPQEVDLQQQAKDALFERPAKIARSGESKAEAVFLKKADAGDSAADIRSVLANEEQAAVSIKEEKGIFAKFFSYLGFNNSDKEPVVNAAKEKERLEKNKSAGKPVNAGEVPVVSPSKSGLLNRIFGF